ncbi:SRSO17 transposase [Paraburkholderia sp. CI3]
MCGVIGSGKTMMLRRLQQALEDEKRVTVSKSLAIEKHRIKLATFIVALFYDLSTEKQVRIPTQGEKREREPTRYFLSGLGRFEGRSWRGFHHHATLRMAAYGFLVAERPAAQKNSSPPDRAGPMRLSCRGRG